ncbi:mucin-2-like isoform X2 [Hermetia illucens]|uniref:mucin-2-like isoform X2 n=1 Tax=Hermetia illucens TaxID=343691 RepID=UPI0018CC6965|nr:mucin-2-like isoform X2 [Hermetia illucens]
MEIILFLLAITIFVSTGHADANCGNLLPGQSIYLDVDCKTFLICVDGQLLPMKCRTPLLYDAAAGVCIRNGQCITSTGTTPTTSPPTIIIPTAPTVAPSIPTAGTIGPTSQTAATPAIPTAETVNPTALPTVTPSIPTAKTIGPISTSSPGIPTAKTITPGIGTTIAPPIPSAGTAGPIVPSTPGSIQPSDSPCKGMPSGLYLNNPRSNTEFFVCYEGNALVTQCPLGTVFVFEAQMCEKVNC